MTGKEALWQQAAKKCVNDYGIETIYSQDHGIDCEYAGDWDCEKCWNSEVVEGSKEGEMTEKQRNMIEGMNMLVKRFSVWSDGQQVRVADIIKASNEVYLEIVGGEEVLEQEKDKQWIPVDERLPKAKEDVLVCTKTGWILIAWYGPRGEVWHITPSDAGVIRKDIAAWMPLPESYRKNGEI